MDMFGGKHLYVSNSNYSNDHHHGIGIDNAEEGKSNL